MQFKVAHSIREKEKWKIGLIVRTPSGDSNFSFKHLLPSFLCVLFIFLLWIADCRIFFFSLLPGAAGRARCGCVFCGYELEQGLFFTIFRFSPPFFGFLHNIQQSFNLFWSFVLFSRHNLHKLELSGTLFSPLSPLHQKFHFISPSRYNNFQIKFEPKLKYSLFHRKINSITHHQHYMVT